MWLIVVNNIMFLFHTGSIKRKGVVQVQHPEVLEFLFHTGSIKREKMLLISLKLTLFLFHTGSIKRPDLNASAIAG